MEIQEVSFKIRKYKIQEVSDIYIQLINEAYKASENAYAPYSFFRVGAAVLLESGIIKGASNQENIAYPSGMCAERVLINYITSNFKKDKIKMLAVVSPDARRMITPCGACRQVMAEVVKRQDLDFEVLLTDSNAVYSLSAGDLLPLTFTIE